MRNLTWIDEKGKKQKMPLRDLRCFIPSHGLNKKSIPIVDRHKAPDMTGESFKNDWTQLVPQKYKNDG